MPCEGLPCNPDAKAFEPPRPIAEISADGDELTALDLADFEQDYALIEAAQEQAWLEALGTALLHSVYFGSGMCWWMPYGPAFCRYALPPHLHTLAGLVLYLAGNIPAAGDALVWQGLSLEVAQTDGPRLVAVRVRPRADAA